MLTRDEVDRFCRDMESSFVERTVSTNKMDKFAEAVCAFANDWPQHRAPGYLFIGVRDDGIRAGLQASDELLASLGGLRSDGNILPIPTLAVQAFHFDDGDVVVVEVRPSPLPPVRYKGRVWIRIGPRRAVAGEQEEHILTERRIAQALTFDALPCPESALGDIDLGLFSSYLKSAIDPATLEANNRAIEDQLASLRFYNAGTNFPTNAGILLFGNNPLFFLPGAYVQFNQYEGNTLTDNVVDEKNFSGDLRSIIKELELISDVLIRRAPVPVSALQEKTVASYPREAIRELLMNAVMHRDYASTTPIRFYWLSDRVMIQNPGGLFGGASPMADPPQTAYRNPVVAEGMHRLGYVNRFGTGILRARAALEKNGNPPLEFQSDQNFSTVTLRSAL